jgi:hypothetical protein
MVDWWFFKGVFEKQGVFWWCFCGENVVKCVVERGGWVVGSVELKNTPRF